MARPLLRGLAAVCSALSVALAPAAAQVRADDSGPSAAVHVVEAGETLSQIAERAGVDLTSIIRLNDLGDANVLAIGQSLKLPPKATVSPSGGGSTGSGASRPLAAVGAADSGQRTYTVAEGDTLWAIAQQFVTTTAHLVDANKLDEPDHLRPGMELLVPPAAVNAPRSMGPVAASPTPGLAPTARGRLLVSYTVQPGETLNQIARQFDVKSEAIAQASSIDNPDRIAVGSVLQVPLPGREHVIAAGETLRDIAQQEKIDLGTLIDFNQLDDPALIHIGQVVLVPARPNLQAAPPSPAAASTSSLPTQAAAAVVVAAPATTAPQPTTDQSTASAAPASKPASSKAKASPPRLAKPAAPVTPPAAAPAGGAVDGLAAAGLKLLGAPYLWGGSSPSGFDCSGFVWYVARQVGKQLSRGMYGEYNGGAHPAREDLKPGDLVFFQNTFSPGLSHNGIYIGNNQFVHAADENAGVTISSLGAAYWSSHWFGATRLP